MTELLHTPRKTGGTPGLRGLPVFGSAVAGLLLGHALSYMLAVPDPYHRDEVLIRTGHGYLPAASQAALILVLAAVAAILTRAWTNRGRGEPERFSSIAGTLALVQIGSFATLEILERVVAGAPLGDLMGDDLLPIGLVVQMAVSLVGAALLTWFARMSGRIVRAAVADRTLLTRPILVEALRATSARGPRRVAASARSVRAPPSL